MPAFSGYPFCGIISLFSVSARFCAPRLSSLAAQPNKQKQMEQKRKKNEQQVSNSLGVGVRLRREASHAVTSDL